MVFELAFWKYLYVGYKVGVVSVECKKKAQKAGLCQDQDGLSPGLALQKR